MVVEKKNGRILFDGKRYHELDYDSTIKANILLKDIGDDLSMTSLITMIKRKALLRGEKVTIKLESN